MLFLKDQSNIRHKPYDDFLSKFRSLNQFIFYINQNRKYLH
jgi:hypothetical protein